LAQELKSMRMSKEWQILFIQILWFIHI
jgi:hypothetical protein